MVWVLGRKQPNCTVYCTAKVEVYVNATPLFYINIRDFKEPDKFEYDRDWCYYMAKDVEDLLRSDAIYLTKGWSKSKGCRVEKAISIEMGKEIIYAED